jgi:hypothetical protein
VKVAYLEKQKQSASTGVRPMPLDIQESLKTLRFRFRRNVAFRPVMGRSGGARFYRVDGKLWAESEILLWAGSGRTRSTESD